MAAIAHRMRVEGFRCPAPPGWGAGIPGLAGPESHERRPQGKAARVRDSAPETQREQPTKKSAEWEHATRMYQEES